MSSFEPKFNLLTVDGMVESIEVRSSFDNLLSSLKRLLEERSSELIVDGMAANPILSVLASRKPSLLQDRFSMLTCSGID